MLKLTHSLAPTTPPQPGASSLWSPSQPPLPDSPPPPPCAPPPPPLPPDSPPPPPPLPDSEEEIMEVEMEMDDDNDTEPPAPGTEEDAGTRPALPPGAIGTNVWESSCFFCISVLICVIWVFHTLFILFIVFFYQLTSFWRHGSPWQRVRNARNPVSRTKLLLAAAPFSTLSLLSAQVKQSHHSTCSFCLNLYCHIFMKPTILLKSSESSAGFIILHLCAKVFIFLQPLLWQQLLTGAYRLWLPHWSHVNHLLHLCQLYLPSHHCHHPSPHLNLLLPKCLPQTRPRKQRKTRSVVVPVHCSDLTLQGSNNFDLCVFVVKEGKN